MHCKEGNCAFLWLVWVCFILVRVEGGVVYFGKALVEGETVKDVAEGDAQGKEVPELGDGISGLAGSSGVGEGEIVVEAADSQEACTERGALLVERRGGGFVEESVVCHGNVNLDGSAGDDGFFAASSRSHGQGGSSLVVVQRFSQCPVQTPTRSLLIHPVIVLSLSIYGNLPPRHVPEKPTQSSPRLACGTWFMHSLLAHLSSDRRT